MDLCNKWGQGQLFAYSGLCGKTDFEKGLCGYLTGDKIGIKFVIPIELELYFVFGFRCKSLNFSAVTSDYISFSAQNRDFSLLFFDAFTVIGELPKDADVRISFCQFESNGFVKLLVSGERFSFAYGETQEEAQKRAENGLVADLNQEKKNKLDFFDKFVPNENHKKLYYKCLSVMKSQVYAPQGDITLRWSTPDRFPHRSAWLWDSIFHAIGFRHIDEKLAEELICSVFTYQGDDGFLPHFFNPIGYSQISQPPIIAFGAWRIYEKSKNKEFLKYVFDRNKKFLSWCSQNRRHDEKYLYTWLTEFDLNCRCGESGMDNSTRFDTQNELYAIDFSCFMANECSYMARIAEELSLLEEKAFYQNEFLKTKNDINKYLWNEDKNFYFDYDILNQKSHCIYSVASFLPIFSGVCDEKQCEELVKTLLDENKFATKYPIACISKDSEHFGCDMWRGPVWINYNYMIAEGLEKYGYNELSISIREKTIELVEKYYFQTGCLFEFYDCEDKKPPYLLNRKGEAIEPYCPFIRYQSIRDYGWTTTLTFDLLNGTS